jgi:exopolysaccharide production protein ExoQ
MGLYNQMIIRKIKGEDGANSLDMFERIFTVVSLSVYMGVIVPLLITQGASEGDGVNIMAFNWMPLNLLFVTNYLITTALIFLRWQRTLFFATQSLPFIGFMLLVPVSFAWSALPESTLTASIGMFGTTLFGLYIASRFTLEEQLDLIAWAFGVAIVLSLIFVIALPKYGVMDAVHQGAIRGVFTHKNGLGKYMVLATSVFLLLTFKSHQKKIILWPCLAASFGLILASSSTGALLNGVMLVSLVLALGSIMRLKTVVLLPLLVFLVLLAWSVSVLAVDILTPILDFFGKDLTLTGRTDIWPAVISKIRERPLLGYGFSGFWYGLGGESADVIRTVRWDLNDSHNGFLELALQLGLLGLSLFFFLTWMTLLKSFAVARFYFSPGTLWPIVVILYAFLINFSESTLMSQNSFFWVLYSSVVFSSSVRFKQIVASSYQDYDFNAA